MSEPWTCPSCHFEWVVPVGGECLSCGYTSGGVREEREVVNAGQTTTLPTLENTLRDDPLAPLYPPGAYPPPVETPAVLNGESPRGMADPRPLDQRGLSEPVMPHLLEENQQFLVRQRQMQETFLGIMAAAKTRIEALQHELSIQEQQVKEAVAAESEVRASLERWQQEAERRGVLVQASAQRSETMRGQVVQLAEANQQLRTEQAKWLASPRPGLTPLPSVEEWPDHLPSRTAPAREGIVRITKLEHVQQEVLRQLGQMSALLDTIVQRLDREQRATSEATALTPETYDTFITTDSQAARIEQEILRSQAQYNQPWRG